MNNQLLKLICNDNLTMTMLLSRIIIVKKQAFHSSLNYALSIEGIISNCYRDDLIIEYPRYSCIERIQDVVVRSKALRHNMRYGRRTMRVKRFNILHENEESRQQKMDAILNK